MNEAEKTPAEAPDLTDCSGSYAIVAARFNRFITDRLLAAAEETLAGHGIGAAQIGRFWVPGAFEIPLLCKKLMAAGEYDAIITLGAVIRGDTPHFDYVAGECARGIAQLNLRGEIPVIFGVLTTDTVAQAMQRAGAQASDESGDETDNGATNKGAEAAVAALEMVSLMKRL